MLLPNAIGLRTISSIVLISTRAAKVCSISSESIPPTLKYEPGVIVADGDSVIIHGRFSGFGRPVNSIAVDIVVIKDGILIERRDVIQDEATKDQSKSGHPMFGKSFPVYA
jgi:hypothetical protein